MPTLKGKYPLNITDTLTFKTVNNAYYLIQITARAKSEKQRKSTDDEEITIKIDDKTFPKLNTKEGLKNSPASFNGGKLHNREQLICFFIYLASGSHSIELSPQYGDGAEVVEVGYVQIDLEGESQLTLNLNTKLEDRDKQPWVTLVLVDVGVKSLSIETFVKWHWLDGDDIKLILNGVVQKAKTTFRKDWIVKTNPLDLFGKSETIKLTPNLKVQDRNYIELYADKSPILKRMNMELVFHKITTQTIQKYQDNKFHRDYNKLDEYISSATDYWNSFFSKQQYPLDKLLDPNLVKAMIYRESTLGYDKNNNGAIDVMQVWNPLDPAQSTLLGKTPESEFIDPNKIDFIHNAYPPEIFPNVTTQKESIFWGVRWLFHKAQHLPDLINPYRREWRTWEDAIRNYNANPELVEDYVKEVFSIYENGVDLKGNVLWKK